MRKETLNPIYINDASGFVIQPKVKVEGGRKEKW